MDIAAEGIRARGWNLSFISFMNYLAAHVAFEERFDEYNLVKVERTEYVAMGSFACAQGCAYTTRKVRR